MTGRNFFNRVTNGTRDILEEFLSILEHNNIGYCVIGGLAVNAYAEPVVSLDLDVVIAIAQIDRLRELLPKGWTVKEDRFSINISTSYSDLRIQLQTDERYQKFLEGSAKKRVLGYEFRVASLEDVFQGKIWAYMDVERRESKRLKDLSDIKRLVESHQNLLQSLPGDLKEKITL